MRRLSPKSPSKRKSSKTPGANAAPGSDSWRDDDERAAEVADDAQLSLQDHLIAQLEYANLAPRDLAIARAIVDAINDDGYVTDSLDDIAATLLPEVTADAAEVERVLKLVQTLDPPGVAARNLSECLTLQLRMLHPDTPGLRLALAIADKHLDLLADRELTLLRRELVRLGRRTGAGRRAGARLPSAPGRHGVLAPRPNTWCPTCSCAAPTAAGPSR